MAISMNPANLAAAQNFLKTMGMAVDPASSRGVKVSVEEAQKLATAFEAIPDAGTKKAVGAALLGLIQMDLFEVPSKSAQDVIAKVVGKPTDQVFSARDKAELVGGASVKSIAAAAMGLLAKAPSLDKAQMEKLTQGLDALPKEAKNLVLSVLNKLGKDGDVKFQPDARSTFTKSFAKAEAQSGGAVSKMEESFSTKGDGPMEFFASQMANSPYFEDRLAALMFMVCAKTMKQVDDDLRGLDDTVKKDGKAKPGATASKPGTGTTPATPPAGETTGTPTTTGTGQTVAKQLRTTYEGIVSAASEGMRGDGVITRGEAKNLAAKLDTISPPEAKALQAEAMGRAILATGKGEVLPDMEPLAKWVEQTLGKPITSVGDATALYEAKTPLAQTIGGSDKLENKVAAYIVEGVFGGEAGKKLGPVMAEMKPLLQALEKEATGAMAQEATVTQAAPKTAGQQIEERFGRIAEAVKSGKVPMGELANVAKSMVDRLPIDGDKKAILEGVTAGLTALVGNKSLDVKGAFSKAVAPSVPAAKPADVASAAVAPLVTEVTKDSPEASALVGGAVDRARNAVSETLYNQKDVGQKPTPAQAKATLEGTLGNAKAQVLEEAQRQGYTPAQLEALGATFDQEAAPLRKELAETGKLQTVEPRGFDTDTANPTGTDESRSRQIMFETLKLKMTRLSEMMQAMSNILNAVHQTAENAIRAIR